MNDAAITTPDGRTARAVQTEAPGVFRAEIPSRWEDWPESARAAIERVERDWYDSGLGKWPAAQLGAGARSAGWQTAMITDDDAYGRLRAALRALTPRQASEITKVVCFGLDLVHRRQFTAAVEALAAHYGLKGFRIKGGG